MPSYFITGASRGLGLQFLDTLSRDSSNTVIGLVRNVSDTEAKISSWNRPNVHLVQGDLTDYDSLKRAVDAVSKITNGSLDFLIANAAWVPADDLGVDKLSELGAYPEKLSKDMADLFAINVTSQIHLFNLFIPLILRGQHKKVVAISSAMASAPEALKYSLFENGPYSISKAALNMVVVKFAAEYQSKGVLFLAICPGTVDTGNYGSTMSPEGMQKLGAQFAKFQVYAPHFKAPSTPEQATDKVLEVVNKATVEKDSGRFVSHTGTEMWL